MKSLGKPCYVLESGRVRNQITFYWLRLWIVVRFIELKYRDVAGLKNSGNRRAEGRVRIDH